MPPPGELDRVAAALAGEQRLDRHGQRAAAALDGEADVDRRLVEVLGRGRASVIVTSIVDRPRPAWSRPCRPSAMRPFDGAAGRAGRRSRGRRRASRWRRASSGDGHDAASVEDELASGRPGDDRVADRRLRLADPGRARPEHDLAARELAVVVEVAVALELLDRVGGLPVPVVVDVARVVARARAGCARAGGRPRRRSSRARSRARPAARRRAGTRPARRRRRRASGRG